MSEPRPIYVEMPDPAQMEIFCRMHPAERVAAALRMTRLLREIVTEQIRSEHPDWSDAQIAEALRQRLHDAYRG